MLTHRGFSAWIQIGDQVIPEYMPSVDKQNHMVQCWIPGEPGQEFSVHWEDHDTGVDSIGFINLDGYSVPGRFLFGRGKTFRDGARSSLHEERPFQFQTTDQATDTSRHPSQLGFIKLSIKRIARGESRAANPMKELPSSQSMLGNDICVGFGQQKKSYEQYRYTWEVKPYPGDNVTGNKPATYVSFIFRYRTPVFLQFQGIVPMTTTRQLTGSSRRNSPSAAAAAPPVASPSRSPHSTRTDDRGDATPQPHRKTLEDPQPDTLVAPEWLSHPVQEVSRRTSSSKGKGKEKSFGGLSAGASIPSGSRLPSTVHRTSSGRLIGTQPGSFPGEGLLCFDEDFPSGKDLRSEVIPESPPTSELSEQFSAYTNWK